MIETLFKSSRALFSLFGPWVEPRLIRPVRPIARTDGCSSRRSFRIRVTNAFRVTNALRVAENNAMTAVAIAELIMRDKGLDEPAGRMIQGVVAIALNGLRKRGVVTLSNETLPRWVIA